MSKTQAGEVRPEIRRRLTAFRALRNPQFRRFYAGSLVSQLGFWFSHISYQDLMSDLTSDELWVSLLFVTTFTPVLFLSPFGGILVDRYDRKRVLTTCYVGLAGAAAFQLTLVITDIVTPLWLLFSGSLIGVGMAVLGPAIQAVTANVVPPSDLPSAISLQAMSTNLSRIVGPAVAAPLIRQDLFEVTWSLYLGAAIFGAFVASSLLLRPYTSDTDVVRVRTRLLTGLQHARERRPAMSCLVLVAVVSTLVVSHTSLMPAFTEDQLGRPKGDFAWIGVATGIGALMGALVAGSLTRQPTLRRGALFVFPYCGLLVLFSQVTSFWWAMGIQVAMGFFYISSFTTMQVVVQQVVDEQFRGRVMSLFQISWAGLVPVGSLVMGIMAGDAGFDLGSSNTLLWTGIAASAWVVAVIVRPAPTRM